MFSLLLAVAMSLAPAGVPGDPPPAAPAPNVRPLRVAVIGDSACQMADRERPYDDWPSQLGRMLGERSEVVNCSRTGTRINPDVQRYVVRMPEMRNAEDARADVVILALGATDFTIAGGAEPWKMRAGLVGILDAMKVFRPEPRIFLCVPPPLLNAGRRGPGYLQALEQNAPMFIEFAREKGLGLIDLREAVKGGEPVPNESPVPTAADATRIAAQVFRALTGEEPPKGSGPYRESLDPDAYERRTLVEAGRPLVPAAGWEAGTGGAAGRLVSGPGGDPLMLEGAIPEGPFRMRWRLRWTRGEAMGEKGGPQFGAGGNWMWLDNRNASMMLIGPDVRLVSELPATARTAPQGEMLDLEVRRSQGVLEWRVNGQVLHSGACPPKAMANTGLRPQGARIELESWTLDVPKPVP